MAEVQAYSGIANPLRIFSTGEDGGQIPAGASDTRTFTISIVDSGTLGGFLSTMNIRNFGAAGTGNIRCSVKRNGQVLAVSTTDIETFRVNFVRGVIFYETLNFLAGAEVFAGETFALEIVTTQSVVSTIDFDARITAVVRAVPRQFLS